MELARFDVAVVQNMVYVFNAGIDAPFNDWSDTALAQGFSWRDGSVGFLLFTDYDPADLSARVHLGEDASPDGATRIIRVPFRVDAGGKVCVSGIYEEGDRSVALDPGSYDLFFALTPGTPATDDANGRLSATFSFVTGDRSAAIERADDELDPPAAFAMDAEPG
ncbi:competence protein J [Sphingomonas sp. PAMC 26605]|uniref:competence protein J n=1 Tax=Sphingomonas sp. PAMC 26605 TaxID=1112214 RepID=UPI00026CCA4F|nr:competence protein J [Sphingomonas sp. PAMC 26605]